MRVLIAPAEKGGLALSPQNRTKVTAGCISALARLLAVQPDDAEFYEELHAFIECARSARNRLKLQGLFEGLDLKSHVEKNFHHIFDVDGELSRGDGENLH